MESESTMQSTLTLSQIALLHPAAVPVLEKFNLDYCCHGKQTLEQACEGDLNKYNTVQEALKSVTGQQGERPIDFQNMELNKLIFHIVNHHHRYVKEFMPVIQAHLQKVSTKHGEGHPELKRIFELFAELVTEMTMHMKKEESVLFPAIVQIEDIYKSGVNTDKTFPITVPISVMEKEHEQAGSILEMIRALTHNYTPPASACTTYQVTFKELKEFEYDLHQHVNLENNILFPRALKMLQNLIQASAN